METAEAQKTVAMSESNGHEVKKMPSAISDHLRDELIRILRTGDEKNAGAFTIAVAFQVEKFVAAAREILMTENLAQNDLGSLMMMRKHHAGSFGSVAISNGDYGLALPSPTLVNNENFGVQAIRQLVESIRTMGDSPAKLVEALAVARENDLTDVVDALEKKLGVSKAGAASVASPEGAAL